jgi:hypothetical protein
VHGGRPRAREPTFRIFTVANLGYTQKYRRSIVILSQWLLSAAASARDGRRPAAPDPGRAAGAFDLGSARGYALASFVRGARKRDDQPVAVRWDLGSSAGPSRQVAAESRANGSMSEVELVRALLAINSAADARARVGSDRPSQRGRPVAAALCLCWQAQQNGHVSPKNSLTSQKIRSVISEKYSGAGFASLWYERLG